MASLVREITRLITQLLSDCNAKYLLSNRMKTLSLVLTGIKEKLSLFKLAHLPSHLLLNLEARLYEFRPILRHLNFTLPIDSMTDLEKVCLVAFSRDEIGTFDAAFGRLQFDIAFLITSSPGEKSPVESLAKLLTEKRRKQDSEKDATEMIKFLRELIPMRKEILDLEPFQKDAFENLKAAMQENEVVMYKATTYMAKIENKLVAFANSIVDKVDENILHECLDDEFSGNANNSNGLENELSTPYNPFADPAGGVNDDHPKSNSNSRKKMTKQISKENIVSTKYDLSAHNQRTLLGFEESDYHFISGKDHIVGYGSFGAVIESTQNDSFVVLKPLPRPEILSLKAKMDLRSLLIIWRERLNACENLVALVGFQVLENHQRFIVLEKCSSTLYDLLHPSNDSEVAELNNINRDRILRGIARGLAFLHGQSLLHQNLKPDNVLLIDSSPFVKLGSFGMGVVREEIDRNQLSAPPHLTTLASRRNLGPLPQYNEVNIRERKKYGPYQAPEVWLDSHSWTPFSDVYSFGIILWEICQLNRHPLAEFRDLKQAVCEDEARPAWPTNEDKYDPSPENAQQKDSPRLSRSRSKIKNIRIRSKVRKVKDLSANVIANNVNTNATMLGKSQTSRSREGSLANAVDQGTLRQRALSIRGSLRAGLSLRNDPKTIFGPANGAGTNANLNMSKRQSNANRKINSSRRKKYTSQRFTEGQESFGFQFRMEDKAGTVRMESETSDHDENVSSNVAPGVLITAPLPPAWIINLSQSCWHPNPQQRPRSEEITSIIEVNMRLQRQNIHINSNGTLANSKPEMIKIEMDNSHSSETELKNEKSGKKASMNITAKMFGALVTKKKSSINRQDSAAKPSDRGIITDGITDIPVALQILEDIELLALSNIRDEVQLQGKLAEFLKLLKEYPRERAAISEFLRHKVRRGENISTGVSPLESKRAVVELIVLIMDTHSTNESITGSCLMLLRMILVNRFDVELCGTLGVGLAVCDAMAMHSKSATIQLFGVLILGSLALGTYALRKQVTKDGAARYINEALKQFENSEFVQRYGIWAIANFLRENEANMLRKEQFASQRNSKTPMAGLTLSVDGTLSRRNVRISGNTQRPMSSATASSRIDGGKSSVSRNQNNLLIVSSSFVTEETLELIMNAVLSDQFRDNVKILVYGLAALLNMINADGVGISGSGILSKMFEKRVHVVVMKKMLKYSGEVKVQEYGVTLLGKFLSRSDFIQELLEDKVLDGIIKAIGQDPYNSKIRYAAWKGLEVLSGFEESVQAVCKVIESQVDRPNCVVVGCMFLKFLADRKKMDFSAFYDAKVVVFIVEKVIPTHIASKQVVLEASLALQAIIGWQTMIKLEMLVDYETPGLDVDAQAVVNNLPEKLQLVETRNARKLLEAKGLELIIDLLAKFKGQVAVLEACLGVLECAVNMGQKGKYDLLRLGKLSSRNALQQQPVQGATEVMVVMVENLNHVSLITQGMSILCELAKWEELGHRGELAEIILFADLSAVDILDSQTQLQDVTIIDIQKHNAKVVSDEKLSRQRKADVNVLGMGLLANRAVDQDYINELYQPRGQAAALREEENLRSMSELIYFDALDVVQDVIRVHRSNIVIQELALETLLYLANNDFGRNKILERGTIDVCQSVFEHFYAYPSVLTRAFLLLERLIVCQNCKEQHRRFTHDMIEEHSDYGFKPIYFLWDDGTVAYKCNKNCEAYADKKLIQLIVSVMLHHTSHVYLIKAGAVVLRAFALGSAQGLEHIREVVTFSPALKQFLPWYYDDSSHLAVDPSQRQGSYQNLIGNRISADLKGFSLKQPQPDQSL